MAKATTIKDINLLLSYHRKPKSLVTKKPTGMKYLFPILLASIMGFWYLSYFNKTHTLQKEVDETKGYLNSSYNIEQSKKSAQLLLDINQKKEFFNILNTKALSLENNTDIDKFHTIYNCFNASVSIQSINYLNNSSLLTLELIATNDLEVNACVKRLIQTGLFDVVNYSGYTFMSDTNQYLFNVNCAFKKGQ